MLPVPGRPNPLASLAALMPCGSASSASGLPRASAMIRSRTRSSSRPGTTVASRARASLTGEPFELQLRQARQLALIAGSRAAKTTASGSASSRRATNPSTCAEAPSSHWRLSTRHSSGCSATSARRPSVASPTRKRSGAAPAATPSATRRAFCRSRERVEAAEQRHAELMQSRERQLHLRLDAGDLRDPNSRRPVGGVAHQRGLAGRPPHRG